MSEHLPPDLVIPELKVFHIGPLDRAFDWWVERSLRREKVWPPERLAVVIVLGWFVVVLLATWGATHAGGWLQAVSFLFLAGAAGGSIAGFTVGRQLAYRRGYRNGRSELYQAWRDEGDKGNPNDWVRQQELLDLYRVPM